MLISLIPVASKAVRDDLTNHIAVVFDVLRATSTIVTALATGCRRVYPVVGADEAKNMAQTSGAMLAGERGGEKIDGFPYGNSPLEFQAEVWSEVSNEVSNEVSSESDSLVLTTSNGTGAIATAHRHAEAVYIGALLNARAVARKVVADGRDVCLVCAGTGGRFSLEDTLGAGFVIDEMVAAAGTTPPMSDLAVAAWRLSQFYQEAPFKGLDVGSHGQKLLRLGREADLHWCARLNQYDLVPVVRGEWIEVSS